MSTRDGEVRVMRTCQSNGWTGNCKRAREGKCTSHISFHAQIRTSADESDFDLKLKIRLQCVAVSLA